MNYVLTSPKPHLVKRYAKRRIDNLFDLGIKDSTVFCIGELKSLIEPNLKTYVEAMQQEIADRGYRVNTKAYNHIRRFYVQIVSERIGGLDPEVLKTSLKRYDAIKFTIGCTYDGIPSVFCHHYPVDSENDDGEYVQPEYVVRVPLMLGNSTIYRNRLDNKAAVFMFGISVQNLLDVRLVLERDNPTNLELLKAQAPAHLDLNPVAPIIAPITISQNDDDDVIPDNICHTTTIVEAIKQKNSSYV